VLEQISFLVKTLAPRKSQSAVIEQGKVLRSCD